MKTKLSKIEAPEAEYIPGRGHVPLCPKCSVYHWPERRCRVEPDLAADNARLRTALARLEMVSTKMLAGGYNGRMGTMHTDVGNAAFEARAALAGKVGVA